jgi:hypothetical protein
VVERVHGEPAILTTFLRDATYTSYVNGVASMDQRLVRFYLRPGYEDPGYGSWNAPYDVPAGSRTGVLATFNGGFKIADAQGGFYLDGVYHGSLVRGSASIVYYKNGTIKIGEWGRDFTMNSSIAGVRQNLRLLVDRGRITPDLDQDVETSRGATLGRGSGRRTCSLTGRRTVRPVEDLIMRDAMMLCLEVGWLVLFCVGLYVA